ncbi:hypothetical protein C7S18_10425 [Ahniella affigens]|uniref:Uncharacterized protein n=1 Tax=Ahniella affigens TaxID=2021234 RepID=A0A2P1PRV8_9GAMM|nr:hypothetical protein C7S18_10425 [Ahniella affigens]
MGSWVPAEYYRLAPANPAFWPMACPIVEQEATGLDVDQVWCGKGAMVRMMTVNPISMRKQPFIACWA